MKLAEWPDDFVLDTDPRREDRLYYYMQRDAWGSAIGVEVSPLDDEEHAASEVSLRIWPQHANREAGMSISDRGRMYCRIVSTLLARFPTWSAVTLQSPHLRELIEQTSLLQVFEHAGFRQDLGPFENERRWLKA